MINLKGPKTLNHFSETFSSLLSRFSVDMDIIQIHASPHSVDEDEELLKYAERSSRPRVFILHRPDELLLRPQLRSFFEKKPEEKLIFLGDLVFKYDFWNIRKNFSKVVPHPYLDVSLPTSSSGKYIIGAYTSWGEMRQLKHYIQLIEEISALDKNQKFIYMIGGTQDGERLKSFDSRIAIKSGPFIPHFNVQLYHLNGKKRYCESSGSLHRGVTIPVIFEANGIERVEGINVIKIEANDKLTEINFNKAAQEILTLIDSGFELLIKQNHEKALLNSVDSFLEQIIS